MSQLLGVAFLAGGLSLIIFNRWLAQRGIEFQESIGSIWSGHKSFVVMRVLGAVLGLYASGIGILAIVRRISFE